MVDECKHENWEPRDSCRIGIAWCLDCQGEIGLNILVWNFQERFNKFMHKLLESIKS